MEVFVTKYALTKGIEKLTVMEMDGSPSIVKTMPPYSRYFHGEGKDWHRQEWQAKAQAKHMKTKKIASLKKAIEKLEKMEF